MRTSTLVGGRTRPPAPQGAGAEDSQQSCPWLTKQKKKKKKDLGTSAALVYPSFLDTCTCSSLLICRDASPTSQIRVEIQVKSALFRLGKEDQGSKEIDCQELFKDYWATTAHEFPVQGQSESPTSPLIVD